MKTALKNTTLADRLLFLILILSSICGLVYTREALSQGAAVVIEVNGKPTHVFSLYGDREITLEGAHGPAVIEIHGGKVRMKEAPCDHHICMKQGWIARGAIVCLPNNIIISISDRASEHIDAITG